MISPFDAASDAAPGTVQPVRYVGGIQPPTPLANLNSVRRIDAVYVTSLDSLEQLLRVMHRPVELDFLRSSFARMSGQQKGQHPLYEPSGGFSQVYQAIDVRLSAIRYSL